MEKEPNPSRKPRADAERNRRLLLDAARKAFTADGVSTSLEQVAQSAGVGIGTLYRHFPTRTDLVAAVYRDGMEKLAASSETLAKCDSPVEGLRQLLLLFVEQLATKLLLADAMKSMLVDTTQLYAESSARIRASMSRMLKRAAEAGEFARHDIEPLDLLRAISGVVVEDPGPASQRAARQMVEIVIDGLRRRD